MGCCSSDQAVDIPKQISHYKPVKRSKSWVAPITHTAVLLPEGPGRDLSVRHEAFGQDVKGRGYVSRTRTITNVTQKTDPENATAQSAGVSNILSTHSIVKAPVKTNVQWNDGSERGLVVNEMKDDKSGPLVTSDLGVVREQHKSITRSFPIVEADVSVRRDPDGTVYLCHRHIIHQKGIGSGASVGESIVQILHKTPVTPANSKEVKAIQSDRWARPVNWTNESLLTEQTHHEEQSKCSTCCSGGRCCTSKRCHNGRRSCIRKRFCLRRHLDKSCSCPIGQQMNQPGCTGSCTSPQFKEFDGMKIHARSQSQPNHVRPHYKVPLTDHGYGGQVVGLGPVIDHRYHIPRGAGIKPYVRPGTPAETTQASEATSSLDNIKSVSPLVRVNKINEPIKRAVPKPVPLVRLGASKNTPTLKHQTSASDDSIKELKTENHEPLFVSEVSESAPDETVEEWTAQKCKKTPARGQPIVVPTPNQCHQQERSGKLCRWRDSSSSRSYRRDIQGTSHCRCWEPHRTGVFPWSKRKTPTKCQCTDVDFAQYLKHWYDQVTLCNQMYMQANNGVPHRDRNQNSARTLSMAASSRVQIRNPCYKVTEELKMRKQVILHRRLVQSDSDQNTHSSGNTIRPVTAPRSIGPRKHIGYPQAHFNRLNHSSYPATLFNKSKHGSSAINSSPIEMRKSDRLKRCPKGSIVQAVPDSTEPMPCQNKLYYAKKRKLPGSSQSGGK